MDKLKDLMEKAGCNPEFIGSICETIEKYKNTIKEQADAELKVKIEQAKKVCLEETEAYKLDLARRVQIFCETKQAGIEAYHQKQAAISESAAVAKLRNLKATLEGVEINGGNKGQATALTESANRQIQQLKAERDQAATVANRQTAIAEKAIARNRELYAENTRLKKDSGATVVAESRTQQNQNKRIDQGRRTTGQPVSTRPTLVESQTRKPAPAPQGGVTRTGDSRGYSINNVAAGMDDVV